MWNICVAYIDMVYNYLQLA
uniref:Uncharacterized protein n=1 Tax=Arundo donax TaxID=35708 RepID=A0A0A9H5N4_ARUDO